ncbi:hypothetical protein [Compostibacter hankyongensis]|uniref:Uncharacterized protein n=1 Tax=Compostibacter hankyongensis TaxID=1007089 RepID=A0ABP8FHM4_9BACT
MRARFCLWVILGFWPLLGRAQDSSGNYVARNIQLDEVVIQAAKVGFDVPGFIRLVEDDTTFYKAFKNLRILGYTADNDIRVFSKNEKKTKASLRSVTRQAVQDGCRTMQVLKEQTTGNFYGHGHTYNYYTAELYASLFFTSGKVCGENNIVAGSQSRDEGGSLARHKEQLKELIFNPGKPIPGVPLVGKKVAIFDDKMAPYYQFSITSAEYNGIPCYVFTARAKPYNRSEVVINELVTYFSKQNFEIVARNYALSYKAFVFDFDVHMEVSMTHFKGYLVPAVIHYRGNWKVPFKKREPAAFDSRFYDFNEGVPGS